MVYECAHLKPENNAAFVKHQPYFEVAKRNSYKHQIPYQSLGCDTDTLDECK